MPMPKIELSYAPPMPERKDFRIGILGSGFIVSDCHLVSYRRLGLNPVAIASRSRENAAQAAARHSIARVCANYLEILDDPSIEVLDIAVPPMYQLELIRAACARGTVKGILAQKPLALSYGEAEEAVRYRLRRSIDRFGRRAEEPVTWDDGMPQAAFRFDRHRSDPHLASGAVYAIDSDLLVDGGQTVSLALRLSPPPGSGDIAYAVRADIGGLRFLEQEGTLQAGGKPVELPMSFAVRGLCDLPVTISVATAGLDPANAALAEQVELVLLDTAAAGGLKAGEAGLVKHLVTENAILALEKAIAASGNPGLSRHNALQRHYRDVLCGRIHTPQGDMILTGAGKAAFAAAARGEG